LGKPLYVISSKFRLMAAIDDPGERQYRQQYIQRKFVEKRLKDFRKRLALNRHAGIQLCFQIRLDSMLRPITYREPGKEKRQDDATGTQPFAEHLPSRRKDTKSTNRLNLCTESLQLLLFPAGESPSPLRHLHPSLLCNARQRADLAQL